MERGIPENAALAAQRRLVEAMREPARYPHPVERVSVIETHISFVLLTGSLAYKIKKAVDLGFVDYTQLAQRRFFCAEELRLNRRLAPRLYLGVAAIGGTADDPRLDGRGETIEVAVKMAEFAQDELFDRVLERGAMTPGQIDALAAAVAAFHAAAPRALPPQPYGSPAAIAAPVLANFAALRTQAGVDRTALDALERWSSAEARRLQPVFAKRQAEGFIREGHGDLHLGNIARFEGELQIFDGIEFNPELRWIDVISDLAFLAMDLAERGRPDYAARLVNAWLEHSGDYAGLDLLRFYQVYRALVRSKVAQLRAAEAGLTAEARRAALAGAAAYLDYARTLITPRRGALLVTHGFSGSGKSLVAGAVAETFGAIRLRADVERKRRHGLPPLARSDSEIDAGLYSEAETLATYARLGELAALVIAAGYPVVIDAACLHRWQRDHFAGLARKLGVPFLILACGAPTALLRQRLASRAAAGEDASEATPAVLERQMQRAEPLAWQEPAVDIAADGLERALAQVRRRLFA